MLEEKRDHVERGADDEENVVATGDIVLRLETIEEHAREHGEEHANESAGHATKADHGCDSAFWKHVGSGGEQIRRPRLMGSAREADEEDGLPIGRVLDEDDRNDAER